MTSIELVRAYFAMWNSGDASPVADIVARGWVDHGHPELDCPEDVAASVSAVRAARPGLRFDIDDVTVDADLVTAVGSASITADTVSRLRWTFTVANGRLSELRTEQAD